MPFLGGGINYDEHDYNLNQKVAVGLSLWLPALSTNVGALNKDTPDHMTCG